MAASKRAESIDETVDNARMLAPWERVFQRFITPFELFVKQQAASGILLLISACLALIIANSGWADTYHALFQTKLSVGAGAATLDKSIHHWINDGLMALFFFVVGLEIKREILVGELSQPRQAALPIVAALGGIIVPALIYFVLVSPDPALKGWAIPMATDIAFAVGALVLLGQRIPASLVTFLLALAIVDDLGALTVLALFYTEDLNLTLLGLGAVVLTIMVAFNRLGLRKAWPYMLGGMCLWIILLKSGVHATLAGVATAFTIPVLPKYHPARFLDLFDKLIDRYRGAADKDPSPLRNDDLRSTLHTMEKAAIGVQAPLERLLHSWEGLVALGIMPLFAFANAGLALDSQSASAALTEPLVYGIVFGLLVGKPVGICGCTWLGIRLGLCQLPEGVSMKHVVGVSLLAAIGFTMSLFIADLAFDGQAATLAAAKLAILLASAIAGVAGLLYLWYLTKDGPAAAPENAENPAI